MHAVGWLRRSLRMFPRMTTTVPAHRSNGSFTNPARFCDSEPTSTRSPSFTSPSISYHSHSRGEFGGTGLCRAPRVPRYAPLIVSTTQMASSNGPGRTTLL